MFHYKTKNENGRLFYNYYYICDKCGEEIENEELVSIEILQPDVDKLRKHYHKDCVDLKGLVSLLV